MTLEAVPEITLADLAASFARDLDDLAGAAKAVSKPLKDLAKAGGDARKAVAAVQRMEKLQTVPEIEPRLKEFTAKVRAHLAEEERRLKFYFGKSLREAAQVAGVEFSPLTTDPPEFRLAPFSVLVDLERRSASLRYARLELATTPPSAEAILDAHRKHLTALEGRGFDPDRYLAHLHEAYAVRLHRTAQPFGTRIDIVEMLPELAFAMQGERFLEDPARENFVPYSRVQMAYDLARLRRAGRLTFKGARLALGAATGGSTKHKSRVLYLEDERGSGQYYLSLWFAREASPQ